MSEQIFISYRREGGDIYAKAICDALKVRGYTVFYDFDSLHGGFFDERIFKAIEGCNDFVLILPPNSLDRCVNEDDWVRLEIKHALDCRKNIIPVMLPGFSFPRSLPHDIANISRINAIPFIMQFFDRAVIPEIIDRLKTPAIVSTQPATVHEPKASEGLEYALNSDGSSYVVTGIGTCKDTNIVIPKTYKGKSVTAIGFAAFTVNPFQYQSTIACKSIRSIFIPNSVTTIDSRAFAGCESLTSISIPNSVTTIESNAFFHCTSLTSISIPNSVTTLGDAIFTSCASLTSISIPSSVDYISKNTFHDCPSLKSIDFDGTTSQWWDIFVGFSINFNVTIHCTNGDFTM